MAAIGDQSGSAMNQGPEGPHAAFELLSRPLQRQLYAMRWLALRPIQSQAIKAYLQTDRDVLIMAETAGGKTEAAFLPILSSIAAEPQGSVRALYIGPLKALINDQFMRLEELCRHLEMPVHRWHGDVGVSKKDALVRKPSGVLLITPESLESLLINRTPMLHALFGGLRSVVIDELHAFLEGERGLHLASLLVRLRRYQAPGEPAFRLAGLSATIGDPEIARRYLNARSPDSVTVIADSAETSEIQFRVHGYDGHALMPTPGDDADDPEQLVMGAIAEDLVEHCRTHSNLVFANAKGDIEIYADLANEACRKAGLPESFLVHHGSLSKEVREDTEEKMKSRNGLTIVCSSTLEMGIDIGSVRTVGQIGAPWSVASLRQRMGRSGRRDGEPRRLRCYVDCTTSDDPADPLSVLPVELLQTIAVAELMLEKWLEPPDPAALDLSTLTHQIMSTIAELGAVPPELLFRRLCEEGPFGGCDRTVFVRLLRAVGAKDIIEQGPDGALILGLLGERLRGQLDFYAVFAGRVEYTIVAGNAPLGTLPMETLPKPGDHIVFAARRWQVIDVDSVRRIVTVRPATRRKRPSFLGGAGSVHHMIRDRMLRLLTETRPLPYLDSTAARALDHARDRAARHGLAQRAILPRSQKQCLWMTWTGTMENLTNIALLRSHGIPADLAHSVGLVCQAPLSDVQAVLDHWSDRSPDLLMLAEHVFPKDRRKYDEYLPPDLLDESIARELAWRPEQRR